MKFPYLLFVSNFYNMEKEAHFTHVTSWQLFNITYNYNLYTLILWQSTNIWHQVPMAQKPTHHWHAPLVPWYSCLASRSNLRTSRRHQACWWWVRDVAVEDPQIHCFMVCLLGNHTELGAFYLGPAFFFWIWGLYSPRATFKNGQVRMNINNHWYPKLWKSVARHLSLS